MRERSDEARAAAAEALAHLTALFLRSRTQFDALARNREKIEATRTMCIEAYYRSSPAA